MPSLRRRIADFLRLSCRRCPTGLRYERLEVSLCPLLSLSPKPSRVSKFHSACYDLFMEESILCLLRKAFSARMKRVTDPMKLDAQVKDTIVCPDRCEPLDDQVNDRAVGREPAYVTSEDDHSTSGGDDLGLSFSHCRSEEGRRCDANGDEEARQLNGKVSDCYSDYDPTDAIAETIYRMLWNQSHDHFRNELLVDVLNGVNIFHSVNPKKQTVHRSVMLYLRRLGYNAGICRTKWESYGGVFAGDHEFMDVVESLSGTRYFIDISFSDEFEIARQTDRFRRLVNILPKYFVGRSEDLTRIVTLMSDAMMHSLERRGLLVPPWRRNGFMQNKWFGPSRRTDNYFVVPAKTMPSVVKFMS